jgi:hypothetical protein
VEDPDECFNSDDKKLGHLKLVTPKYKNMKGLWQLAMTEIRLNYQPILMYHK